MISVALWQLVFDPASSARFRSSNPKAIVRPIYRFSQRRAPLQVPLAPSRLVTPAVNPAASNVQIDPPV